MLLTIGASLAVVVVVVLAAPTPLSVTELVLFDVLVMVELGFTVSTFLDESICLVEVSLFVESLSFDFFFKISI